MLKNIKHLIFPTPPNIYCLCPKYQTKTKTCQHTKFLKCRKQMAMSRLIKSFLLISRSNASNERKIFRHQTSCTRKRLSIIVPSVLQELPSVLGSGSFSRQSKRLVWKSTTWLFIYSGQQALPTSALAAQLR